MGGLSRLIVRMRAVASCAFVELKPGAAVTAEEIIGHWKKYLAGFEVSRSVFFGEVPKTSIGKHQKFELRRRAASTGAIDA